MRARIDWLVLLIGISASRAARGKVGVQAGPHGGVMFRGDADSYLGLDLRLSVPSSPVQFQSTFDYVFDAKERLYSSVVQRLGSEVERHARHGVVLMKGYPEQYWHCP